MFYTVCYIKNDIEVNRAVLFHYNWTFENILNCKALININQLITLDRHGLNCEII